MPNSAAHSLQRAIFAKLVGTPALVTKLGADRVYEDVPAKPVYPFISFGSHIERDWSTGTEVGSEHTVTLHVWSLARTREEAASIMDLARTAIAGLAATLESFRLVSIRHEQSEIERETASRRIKGTLRFKALTEPL